MNPILIQFSDTFFIGWYGVMIAAGLLAAVWLAVWRGRKLGIHSDVFFDLALIAGVAGLLGGRLLYILTEFDGFLRDPVPYVFSRTGFVFLGGLLGAVAACAYYVRRKGLDFWKVADVAMPSVAVGHAFGRVGCHQSGCCFGGVCDHTVGLEVPRVEIAPGDLWYNAYYDHLQHGLIPPTATHSLLVWPVQLMEAGSLILLAAALILIGLRPHRAGLIFGLYMVGYGVIRFALEYLRGDEARGVYFGGLLSTSQIISIVLLAIGGWVLATARNRPMIEPAKPAAKSESPPSSDTNGQRPRNRRR